MSSRTYGGGVLDRLEAGALAMAAVREWLIPDSTGVTHKWVPTTDLLESLMTRHMALRSQVRSVTLNRCEWNVLDWRARERDARRLGKGPLTGFQTSSRSSFWIRQYVPLITPVAAALSNLDSLAGDMLVSRRYGYGAGQGSVADGAGESGVADTDARGGAAAMDAATGTTRVGAVVTSPCNITLAAAVGTQSLARAVAGAW